MITFIDDDFEVPLIDQQTKERYQYQLGLSILKEDFMSSVKNRSKLSTRRTRVQKKVGGNPSSLMFSTRRKSSLLR